jgi:hypothetical protein
MYNDTWEQVNNLWEEFQQSTVYHEPVNLKRQALFFLRKKINKKLTRSDLRRMSAKINKMKNSVNKEQKARAERMAHQLQQVFKCET